MSGTLVLAEHVVASIARDCRKHPDTETGGLLIGQRIGPDIVVPFVVGAGPHARRARSSFEPDPAWQQEHLDFLFERFGLDYVGDWHLHPSDFDRPSDQDYRTAFEIVNSPSWEVLEAVFPIAVNVNGEIRLRAYTLSRFAARAFVELPVVVVPDEEPRMRFLLCGDRCTRR